MFPGIAVVLFTIGFVILSLTVLSSFIIYKSENNANALVIFVGATIILATFLLGIIETVDHYKNLPDQPECPTR